MKQLIDLGKLIFPPGTYFSKNHTWIRRNEYGLVKLGLDEIICGFNEELTIENIAKAGTSLSKDDLIFEIASGQKRILITSPIAGIPMFYNPFIFTERITDPYEDGWIALIQANDYFTDKKLLMTGEEYKNWVAEENKKSGDKQSHA